MFFSTLHTFGKNKILKKPDQERKILFIYYIFFYLCSGTVVSGRVTRGKLKTGQEVEVIGYGKSVKCKVNGKI